MGCDGGGVEETVVRIVVFVGGHGFAVHSSARLERDISCSSKDTVMAGYTVRRVGKLSQTETRSWKFYEAMPPGHTAVRVGGDVTAHCLHHSKNIPRAAWVRHLR